MEQGWIYKRICEKMAIASALFGALFGVNFGVVSVDGIIHKEIREKNCRLFYQKTRKNER